MKWTLFEVSQLESDSVLALQMTGRVLHQVLQRPARVIGRHESPQGHPPFRVPENELVVPIYLFLGEGSPTEIDYRKREPLFPLF